MQHSESDQNTLTVVSPSNLSAPPSVVGSECSERDSLSLNERLVDMMESYPCLWNTSSRSYKDINKKDEAWKELQRRLGVPGNIITKYYLFKIVNLKSCSYL